MKLPAESIAACRENMLTAKKSRLFEKIFALYNRNLIKRRFHLYQVSGLDYLINKNPNIPLLIYANHTSWWDGLLAFEISRAARLDSFIMMDELNLRRFFLFQRLGAFSIFRGFRGMKESIKYSSDLMLANSTRTLWIFPQGEIVPYDFRPIHFYNGAARIVEKVGKCLTVPLAFRLEFTGEFKPEIFVKIGKPNLIEADKGFNSKSLTADFSKIMTLLLDELKYDVINRKTANYRNFW